MCQITNTKISAWWPNRLSLHCNTKYRVYLSAQDRRDRTGRTKISTARRTTQHTATQMTNKMSICGIIIISHHSLAETQDERKGAKVRFSLISDKKEIREWMVPVNSHHHHLVTSNKPTNLAGDLPAQQKTIEAFEPSCTTGTTGPGCSIQIKQIVPSQKISCELWDLTQNSHRWEKSDFFSY